MSKPRSTHAPWMVFDGIALVSVLVLVAGWRDQGILPLVAVAIAAVGTLILVKGGNPLGWLFDLAASSVLLESLLVTYLFLRSTSEPSLPAGGYVAIASNAAIIPAVTAFGLLLLWFPTGRPPSRRWTPISWAVVVSSVVLIGGMLIQPGVIEGNHAEGIANPLGVASLADVATILGRIGGWGLFLASIACVASLFVRFRSASGDEREQLRWLAAAGGLALAFFLLAGAVELTQGADWIGAVGWTGFLVSLALGIPAAVTVAILKYRLYDIDLVISKTIVYGLLAGFIGAVYVAIVVGVGLLLGLDAGNPALSIAATGIVALTFQGVRERVQRVANRLVYGDRATPYEVLTRFSERVGSSYATEDVLPRTVRVIAEGVNAERATVWLRLADELRPASSWPRDDEDTRPSTPLTGGEFPAMDADHVAPIHFQGELLGAITVDKPRGGSMTPEEVKLVDDLAAQAGLVVSNVRLTADLEAQLAKIAHQAEQLRASRQRIVAAQDEERRRLERNIHDGAQQHLVALAVKLRLTRALIARDPDKAATMLREITAQVDDAIETLRTLALGIYPPLLEEHGVAAALAAQYQRSELPVHMSIEGAGRYPIETEAAVYFCVLEALQNAAKYAHAGSIEVSLTEREGGLTFEVADDGVGFDRAAIGDGTGLGGMRDRLAVLGGDVELTSHPGRGTTVRGRVPLTLEGVPS